MQRIAVIGSKTVRCILYIERLAVMAGVAITHHNYPYDSFGNNNSTHAAVKFNWQELFASTLTAFSTQIEEEQHQAPLLLNGGALYHLAFAEKILSQQNSKSKVWHHRLLMFAGFKRVVLEYVREHYKEVILVLEEPSNETDEIIAKLLDDANVRYITIDAIMSDEEMLNIAAAFIGIVPATSASDANRKSNKKLSHSHRA